MFDKTRKNRPKSFLRWKGCIFFSKHCFSNNLLGPKKGFYRFRRVCQSSLWTLLKRWVTFVMFDKTRKIRPKAISHYKDCLFSPKLRVLNNLLGPKKTNCQVQEYLSKFICDCTILFFEVFHMRYNEERSAKNFCHRENSCFWNVCFYRPLRSQRNYLIICKINVRIPCVPKQYVPWHSSCSIKREKLSQNFFFAWKAAFFFKALFLQQPLRS